MQVSHVYRYQNLSISPEYHILAVIFSFMNTGRGGFKRRPAGGTHLRLSGERPDYLLGTLNNSSAVLRNERY